MRGLCFVFEGEEKSTKIADEGIYLNQNYRRINLWLKSFR